MAMGNPNSEELTAVELRALKAQAVHLEVTRSGRTIGSGRQILCLLKMLEKARAEVAALTAQKAGGSR